MKWEKRFVLYDSALRYNLKLCYVELYVIFRHNTGSFLELGLNKQTKKSSLNDQVKGLGRNSCSIFKDNTGKRLLKSTLKNFKSGSLEAKY